MGYRDYGRGLVLYEEFGGLHRITLHHSRYFSGSYIPMGGSNAVEKIRATPANLYRTANEGQVEYLLRLVVHNGTGYE